MYTSRDQFPLLIKKLIIIVKRLSTKSYKRGSNRIVVRSPPLHPSSVTSSRRLPTLNARRPDINGLLTAFNIQSAIPTAPATVTQTMAREMGVAGTTKAEALGMADYLQGTS